MTEPHWGMLERRTKREPPADLRAWQLLHLRVFGSPDGKEWLERMRALLYDQQQRDDIPESKLRSLEAQRNMLRDIERLTALGEAVPETPKVVK